jgi:hypothetical protein
VDKVASISGRDAALRSTRTLGDMRSVCLCALLIGTSAGGGSTAAFAAPSTKWESYVGANGCKLIGWAVDHSNFGLYFLWRPPDQTSNPLEHLVVFPVNPGAIRSDISFVEAGSGVELTRWSTDIKRTSGLEQKAAQILLEALRRGTNVRLSYKSTGEVVRTIELDASPFEQAYLTFKACIDGMSPNNALERERGQ